jgi:integrase
MALLLHTAGRREDAVRLGPQHFSSNRIRFTQAKNEHRKPVRVDLPSSPELAAIIAATPGTGHLAFLVTAYGRPFTHRGFGHWFRKRCDEAGLPQCSAHGLRKAAATRLAESGATTQEIMAVTGHQSLRQVEVYTKAAARPGMADAAFVKLRREL